MAKVIVPVIKLNYSQEDAYDLRAAELFANLGFHVDDPYTYTMRVTVVNDSGRREVREKLAELLGTEEAQRLIKVLEENDWDVSFFVDAW